MTQTRKKIKENIERKKNSQKAVQYNTRKV